MTRKTNVEQDILETCNMLGYDYERSYPYRYPPLQKPTEGSS